VAAVAKPGCRAAGGSECRERGDCHESAQDRAFRQGGERVRPAHGTVFTPHYTSAEPQASTGTCEIHGVFVRERTG
jgi:hypothetical protein